jgi:hypothetical protein
MNDASKTEPMRLVFEWSKSAIDVAAPFTEAPTTSPALRLKAY